MKTSTKVWLGIGGYLTVQAIGAGIGNARVDRITDNFNAKCQEVKDLFNSKQNEMTVDEYANYLRRIENIADNVRSYWINKGETILLSVGAIRIHNYSKMVNDSMKALDRIADDIRGVIIDSEVVD